MWLGVCGSGLRLGYGLEQVVGLGFRVEDLGARSTNGLPLKELIKGPSAFHTRWVTKPNLHT